MTRYVLMAMICIMAVAITLQIAFLKENKPIAQITPTTPVQPFTPVPPQEPEPEPEPPKIEPEWTEEAPLRSVSNLGKILSDIESHMPRGHIYRDNDKITWAHETTHGIHSRLRNKHRRPRINCFYVLDNKAVIIDEPSTTIREAARLVPKSLRGGVYNLYMVQQTRYWNNQPLYVFDEWVAYTNGSECRLDLGISSRGETVQFMLEFNVYAICVAWACKSEDPQFKNFLMWHLERTMDLYDRSKGSGNLRNSGTYLEKMRTSSGAEEFRQFAKNYFGELWIQKTLGF